MKVQNKRRSEKNQQVRTVHEEVIQTPKHVFARILVNDEKNQNFEVYLPGDKIGVLPYAEVSIYQLEKSKKTQIPLQALDLFHKNFKVKVIGESDDKIIVSRKAVQEDIFSNFSVGDIVDATITNITSFGIFVNLGENVIALLHVSEISKARIYNISKWFSIGDKIKVKITEIINDSTKRITVSRKKLYTPTEHNRSEIVKVRISCKHDNNSYFVELDPATTGIMDIDYLFLPELQEGQVVTAIIKKKKDEGKYKLDMLPL